MCGCRCLYPQNLCMCNKGSVFFTPSPQLCDIEFITTPRTYCACTCLRLFSSSLAGCMARPTHVLRRSWYLAAGQKSFLSQHCTCVANTSCTRKQQQFLPFGTKYFMLFPRIMNYLYVCSSICVTLSLCGFLMETFMQKSWELLLCSTEVQNVWC